jgi:YggT family protein
MLGNIFATIVQFIGGLVVWLFLFRFWLQLARAPFNNPLVQAMYNLLAPVLRPFERIIPKWRNANLAALLIALLLATLTGWLIFLLQGAAPGLRTIVLAGLSMLLYSGYWMILIVLILFALMSFFVVRDPSFPQLAACLVRPMLRPIQRIVPNVGPFDFSIAVVALLLSIALMLSQYLLSVLAG